MSLKNILGFLGTLPKNGSLASILLTVFPCSFISVPNKDQFWSMPGFKS